MLSLDPGRSSPAVAARAAASGGGLIARGGFAAFLSHHWPVAWSIVVLAACRAGEDAGAPVAGIAPQWWGRLAAAVVLGQVGRRRSLVMGGLLVAGLAAYQCGAGFTRRLVVAPAAVAPAPGRPSTWVEDAATAVVRIRARPRVTAGGRWSAPATVLRAVSVSGADTVAAAVSVPIYLRGDGAPPLSGSLLVADLELRRPARAAVPGGFDTAAWLAGRGIGVTGRLARGRRPEVLGGGGPLGVAGARRDRVQASLRRALARGLPPREHAIASGVLLGGGTAGELRDPFARLGLAHLFALSGLHVGILAGLCLLAFAPFGASPSARLGLLAPLLAAYVVLVDLPGSVVRAAGLVVLVLLAPVVGRKVDSLRLLGLLLWCNVLWQPAALLDTGTRLSYLAAGGIVAGQRLLGPWLRHLPRRARVCGSGLGVTVSAQVATLPEVARSFGYLPLGGPLANLVLVPVFGFAVTLLAVGLVASLVWPWAGEAILSVAWLLLRPLEAATAAAAAAGAGMEVGLGTWGIGRSLGFGACVAALVAAARGRRRRGIALAAAAYVAVLGLAAWRPPAAGGLDAWQFSVGQGDAALLRFPDGWTCMVDTGESWRGGGGPLQRDVLPFLRRKGLRRLDAVVLTHGHADHTGGRDALAAAVAVGQWYTGGSARAGSPPSLRPADGDTLHATARWALVCLHPAPADTEYAHENDRSVVLGLYREGLLRGLWAGDLERSGEQALSRHLSAIPAAGLDVLKAGHHGSATSSGPALLESLRPRIVLISCGVANRHGHPSHGPWLAGAEAPIVLRTDLQGTVHLRWNRAGRLAAEAMRPLPTPRRGASLDTP